MHKDGEVLSYETIPAFIPYTLTLWLHMSNTYSPKQKAAVKPIYKYRTWGS